MKYNLIKLYKNILLIFILYFYNKFKLNNNNEFLKLINIKSNQNSQCIICFFQII